MAEHERAPDTEGTLALMEPCHPLTGLAAGDGRLAPLPGNPGSPLVRPRIG